MEVGRSPLSITLSVWHALLLREALSRLFSRRAAWAWMLLEPALHMAFLVFVFTVIRVKHVGGIETSIWLIVGLQSFFLFRRTATQAGNAVEANRSLFAYRQVKPVDAILVRSVLEGLLLIAVSLVVFCGLALLGVQVLPSDPLAVMQALLGLWLLAIGFGMVVAVGKDLFDEFSSMLTLVMLPLYLISGVIMPIASVPYPYREWLMYNPVAHGLEAARLGFAPYYHAAPELSVAYLYAWALVLLFMGLVLQVRFAQRLVSR
jgi:capsular polysaccharide transport system permease protein